MSIFTLAIRSASRNFIALACALSCAAPAVAQAPSGLGPSDPTAIVAAAQSCKDAVGASELDERRLAADGWERARMEHDGRKVDSPLRIFGRGSIILLVTPGDPGCVVTARLSSAQAYEAVVGQLETVFGRPDLSQSESQRLWLLEGEKAMQIDRTGTAEAPAVRIAVIHNSTR